jgi:hypothetical protein
MKYRFNKNITFLIIIDFFKNRRINLYSLTRRQQLQKYLGHHRQATAAGALATAVSLQQKGYQQQQTHQEHNGQQLAGGMLAIAGGSATKGISARRLTRKITGKKQQQGR